MVADLIASPVMQSGTGGSCLSCTAFMSDSHLAQIFANIDICIV